MPGGEEARPWGALAREESHTNEPVAVRLEPSSWGPQLHPDTRTQAAPSAERPCGQRVVRSCAGPPGAPTPSVAAHFAPDCAHGRRPAGGPRGGCAHREPENSWCTPSPSGIGPATEYRLPETKTHIPSRRHSSLVGTALPEHQLSPGQGAGRWGHLEAPATCPGAACPGRGSGTRSKARPGGGGHQAGRAH